MIFLSKWRSFNHDLLIILAVITTGARSILCAKHWLCAKKGLPSYKKTVFIGGASHFFAHSQSFAHSMLQAPVVITNKTQIHNEWGKTCSSVVSIQATIDRYTCVVNLRRNTRYLGITNSNNYDLLQLYNKLLIYI
jgi:hypothetical protein